MTGSGSDTGQALVSRLVRHDMIPVVAVGEPTGALVAVDGAAVADHSEITVDLDTHSSITAALEGIDTVVHAADVRPGRSDDVVESVRAIAGACADRGVHLILLSRVGADASSIGHRKQLWAGEQLVEATKGLGWTIQRVTHPHPSIVDLVDRPVYALPAATPLQPVSPDDIAGRLVGLVHAGASERVRDFAGPELMRFADFVHIQKQVRGDAPRKIPFPRVAVFAEALDGVHVSQTADRGTETFREWLKR